MVAHECTLPTCELCTKAYCQAVSWQYCECQTSELRALHMTNSLSLYIAFKAYFQPQLSLTKHLLHSTTCCQISEADSSHSYGFAVGHCHEWLLGHDRHSLAACQCSRSLTDIITSSWCKPCLGACTAVIKFGRLQKSAVLLSWRGSGAIC